MKFINRPIIFLILSIILFVLLSIFKDNYNFYWIESTPTSSKVTINFLVPMSEGELNNHINWVNTEGIEEDITYSLRWVNSHTVCIDNIRSISKEINCINLIINNTPTQQIDTFKSEKIIIPLKKEVILLRPKSNTIVSSSTGFEVSFNTPINIDTLYKSIQSDVEFYIEPMQITNNNNKTIIDFKTFKFTPKKPLNNGDNYIICFKKGIATTDGELLDKNIFINLYVDNKPCIIDSYPKNNSKWIGLYPRFTVKTKSDISSAILLINNTEIKGEVSKDGVSASFALDNLLAPDKSYKAIFTVKSLNGEESNPYTVNFITTSINNDTIWLQILSGKNSCIECYKGTTKIKTIPCSIGTIGYTPKFGTYYLQNKSQVYISSQNDIKANYWLKISENYGLHGYPRDDYWNVKSNLFEIKSLGSLHENIILLDSDIEWLYNNIPADTMIILKNH